jgi:hypothetical protein
MLLMPWLGAAKECIYFFTILNAIMLYYKCIFDALAIYDVKIYYIISGSCYIKQHGITQPG